MTETITIHVDGMTCAACQSHVRQALEHTQGVSKAAVNLMAGEATVVFDPAAVQPTTLVGAIRDSGYEADLRGASDDDAENDAQAREQAQVSAARDLLIK